jgi:probable aminopeptidase NPEPL1
MTSFNVTYSYDTPISVKKDIIVIAASKDFYTKLTVESNISEIAQFSEVELEMIKHGAQHKLNPTQDNISSLDFSFMLNEKPGIRKCIISVLPTGCSRHNTASRSHAISAFVKSSRGSSSNIMIYIAPKELKLAFAQSCAIARAFPTFTKKTSNATIANNFHIVIDAEAEQLQSKSLLFEIESVIHGIRLAQRLVDSPPNILTTTNYFQEIVQVVNKLQNPNVKIHTHLEGAALETAGFGGMWNVGKAGEFPPIFVVLSYIPPGMENRPPISFVGKGN